MDCIVHGGAKSQTRLSDFYFDFTVIQPVSEQLPLQKHKITPGGEEGKDVPIGMASIKQTEISKAGEDVEKLGPCALLVGMENGAAARSMGGP